MFQKNLAKFTTKKGKEVEIVLPKMERLPQLLEFVNRLVAEDSFLSLTGKPKTIEEEKLWLAASIANMKVGKAFLVWAIYENKIIGSCDIIRGHSRDPHVGMIGLMVDQDFRGEGIGRYLIEFIIEQARKMKDLKIVHLHVFSDNNIAINLYKKLGFKEYSRLPNGFIRQGKYSDHLMMYKNL